MKELFTLAQLASVARPATWNDLRKQLDELTSAGLVSYLRSALPSYVLINGVQQREDVWKIPGGLRGYGDWEALLAAMKAARRLNGNFDYPDLVSKEYCDRMANGR
jgi:hypothetical protein